MHRYPKVHFYDSASATPCSFALIKKSEHDGCHLVLEHDHCFYPTKYCTCGPKAGDSLVQPVT